MTRRSNQKRNRVAYGIASRQNQGPSSALSPLEQQIIAEQKAAREKERLAQEKQRVAGVIII